MKRGGGEKTSNILKGIKKNVVILGFASLLNDVSAHVIMPLLPIYLTSVLGADKTAIGLIEGVAESTSSFLKVLVGRTSDKIRKRKKFVSAGYFIGSISRFFHRVCNILASSSWSSLSR